jgi:WD40 repeat protein
MRLASLWLGSLFIAGCGTDTGSQQPVERSVFEKCVFAGGNVHELWATSNLHGPVASIAVAGSTVVLGSEDHSVKQWSVTGASPNYRTPFTEDAGSIVGALTLSSDDHVLGGNQAGQLIDWRLADAKLDKMTTIGEASLVAVAVNEAADHVLVAGAPKQMSVVDRGTGSIVGPLTTRLWGVTSAAFGSGAMLMTAGHFYGTPMIERRSADSPTDVIETWGDERIEGLVNAIALDRATLVAVGDGFVGTFAPGSLSGGPTAISRVPDHQAIGVVLFPSGDLFATAGRDGSLRIWKTATAENVARLTIPIPIGVGIDAAGDRLFTSGADGLLHAFACQN